MLFDSFGNEKRKPENGKICMPVFVISKKNVLWQIMWTEATSEQRILQTVHKLTSTSIPRKKKKRRSHQR